MIFVGVTDHDAVLDFSADAALRTDRCSAPDSRSVEDASGSDGTRAFNTAKGLHADPRFQHDRSGSCIDHHVGFDLGGRMNVEPFAGTQDGNVAGCFWPPSAIIAFCHVPRDFCTIAIQQLPQMSDDPACRGVCRPLSPPLRRSWPALFQPGRQLLQLQPGISPFLAQPRHKGAALRPNADMTPWRQPSTIDH